MVYKVGPLMISVVVLLPILGGLAGCGLIPVVQLAGMVTQDTSSAEILIPDLGSRPDILDLVTAVGNELGYKDVSRSEHFVTFMTKPGSSFATSLVTGVTTSVSIIVSRSVFVSWSKATQEGYLSAFQEDVVEQKRKEIGSLTVKVMVSGDFGTGGKENASIIANGFKEKLLERTANR